MKLGDVVKAIGGETPQTDSAFAGLNATTFVIDSREVKAGDVFFALSQPEYADNGFNGDFDDSTRYVASALEAGAAAAVLRRERFEEHRGELEKYVDRLIFVDDAIAALQRLAHAVYEAWGKKVVAVTGSAGKTTAKELTAQVLASSGLRVLKNIRNYNNGLGHPLTVLNLAKDPGYDVAVLEMGMSTPMNEIQRLCRITPPDIAVELNVLPVHIEHLGTIERIADAKAELIEGMKSGGTAVLNADDEHVAAMHTRTSNAFITYGIEQVADVWASKIEVSGFGGTNFQLTTPQGSADVKFRLNGRHNIANALAAAAVGHVFGMEATAIASALATTSALRQRGEILRFSVGFTVINDSYNSNPDALLSMVETLVNGAPENARKLVVAGEMLELGDESVAIHRRTGEQIGNMDIDILIGVRGNGRDLAAGAVDAGLGDARFVESSDAAGEMLADLVGPGDVILVKGSRGVRTEKVVEKLLERFELEGKAASN